MPCYIKEFERVTNRDFNQLEIQRIEMKLRDEFGNIYRKPVIMHSELEVMIKTLEKNDPLRYKKIIFKILEQVTVDSQENLIVPL